MRGPTGRSPRSKSIFDPVHGPISLSGVALELVATAPFQRMWGIRQTGFAHLVFPGANHTRLEHSLGTYSVAGQMADRLRLASGAAERVAVAALLHDVGHPPFSHILDGPLREVMGVDHERLSRRRIVGEPVDPASEAGEIPRILDRAGIAPRAIADLIDPPRASTPPRLESTVLHSAIDADRLDYLQRDAHYTGVAHGAIDAGRLLDTLRVERGTPYYAEKGRSAVEGFLVGRALMYASVYYHKTVRAAEVMAQAAVERSAGYPESAASLFVRTDGEILVALRSAGAVSRRLVDGLLARRLYKRVRALANLSPGDRRKWRQLAADPPARRAFEDDLSSRLGARPASVAVDLSGLDPRGTAGADWGRVGVGEPGRIRYPFRSDGPWRALVLRPPSDWAVSVYVAPELRSRAAEKLTERALRAAVN